MGPHLSVVATSAPEAELRAHNLVVMTPDEEEARRAVVALEEAEDDRSAISLVVMSQTPEPVAQAATTEEVDPEHVAGYVARRSLAGGVVGAILGAVILGGIVAFITDGWAPIIAAALAGLLFFSVYGAIVRTFSGMGGSSSYRASFVAPEVADVVLVGYLTDDGDRVHEATERLSRHDLNARLVTVDAAGRPH